MPNDGGIQSRLKSGRKTIPATEARLLPCFSPLDAADDDPILESENPKSLEKKGKWGEYKRSNIRNLEQSDFHLVHLAPYL